MDRLSRVVWELVLVACLVVILVRGLVVDTFSAQTVRCDRETGSERCTVETNGSDPVVYDNLWAVRAVRNRTRRREGRTSALVFLDRRGTHEAVSSLDNRDAERVAQWYAGKEPRVEVARPSSLLSHVVLLGGVAAFIVVVVVWTIRRLRRHD